MDKFLTTSPDLCVRNDDLWISLSRGIAYRNSDVQRVTKFYTSASWGNISQFRSGLLADRDQILNIGWFSPIHKTKMLMYDFDPTRVSRFQSAKVYADPFKAIPPKIRTIVLWDCLDTLIKPSDFLQRIRPGTVLYVSLPVFDDLLQVGKSHYYDPGRIYYFTESGFVCYISSQNFTLLEIHRDEEEMGLPGGRVFVFIRN